jgi:HEAT repeat protein
MDAVSSLASILRTNSDAVVREAAAGALARLPDAQGVLALRGAVEDQDPRVRAGALLSLGQLYEEGSAGIMAQVLTRDPDAGVRQAAVWALAALQGAGALRALHAAASDPDAGVRQAAASALRQWQNRPRPN